MSNWVSINDGYPDVGKPVFVYYTNKLGKGRTVKAFWAKKFTIEDMGDYRDMVGDYDEERDMYYLQEGWWEMVDNWDEWSHVEIDQGEPTHWMPLPEPPEGE